MIGNPPGDQGAVGEKGQGQAFALGVGVYVKKVAAQQRLTAGEQEPKTASVGNLVQDTLHLLQAQLTLFTARGGARPGYSTAGSAGCSAGFLERAGDGDALITHLPVQPLAEFTIS